jgi:hypothetical protein
LQSAPPALPQTPRRSQRERKAPKRLIDEM